MKKTNFTLMRFVLLALVCTLFGWQSVMAQCPGGAGALAPMLTANCDDTHTITWTQTDPGASTFTVVVQTAGGVNVVNFVNMTGASVTIGAGILSGLVAADFPLDVNVNENCTSGGVVWSENIAVAMAAITPANLTATVAIANVVPEACPGSADGSYDIVVTDPNDGSCPGTVTYTAALDATDVAGGTVVLPGVRGTGAAANTVTFAVTGVSSGDAIVDVTPAGMCGICAVDMIDAETIGTLAVGVDDPATVSVSPASPIDVNLNAGECTRDVLFSIVVTDDFCVGGANFNDLVSANMAGETQALPVTVGVIEPNATNPALVDVHYTIEADDVPAGTSSVQIFVDEDGVGGNPAVLTETVVINLNDVTAPIIDGSGQLVVDAPPCPDGTQILAQHISVTDDCDGEILLATSNFTVSGSLVGPLTAGVDFIVSTVGGASNNNLVLLPSAIPDWDAFPAATNEFYQIDVSVDDAAGNTGAETFFLQLERPTIEDTNPVVTVPGNLNFEIPACEASLDANVAIQVSDVCDDQATIEANSDQLTLEYFNNVIGATETLAGNVDANVVTGGYFEFTVTLTAANNGDLMTASYTDTDGNTTTIDFEIVVAQDADNAPIIDGSGQIVVDAPSCPDGSQILAQHISVTDDCDGEIFLTEANFTVTGNNAVGPLTAGVDFIVSTVGGASNNNLVLLPSAIPDWDAFPGLGNEFYQIDVAVTDAAGNPANETFFLQLERPTIEDTHPVVTVPGNLNFNIAPCETSIDALVAIQVSDVCDDLATIEANADQLTLEYFNDVIGATEILAGNVDATNAAGTGYFEFTVTLTEANDGDVMIAEFTDTDGNTSTVDFQIAVNQFEDNDKPHAHCTDISITLDDTGQYTLTAADEAAITAGSVDDCGAFTIAIAPNSFDCTEIGANTVTVTLTDGNSNQATCTAVVTVLPGTNCIPDPTITDPCACGGEIVVGGATVFIFDEEITVESPNAGETWQLQAGSAGLVDAAGAAIAAGTALVEQGDIDNDGLIEYTLDFHHVEGIENVAGSGGYNAIIDRVGTPNPGGPLTIGNRCYRPDPAIQGLAATYVVNGANPTITGTEVAIGGEAAPAAGTGTFSGVPGAGSGAVPSTVVIDLDPNSANFVGAGNHTLTYSIDAGAATGENPAGEAAAEADPGCVEDVSQNFSVSWCGATGITDLGGAANNYPDDQEQTLVICPDNAATQIIRLNFTQWDIANGDVVEIYDGNAATGTPLFTDTDGGTGVPQSPGGGWIDAQCSNASGCLTFHFDPNGDNVKGAGFSFNVSCEARPSEPVVEKCNAADGEIYAIAECDGDVAVNVNIPRLDICAQGGMLNYSSDCGGALTAGEIASDPTCPNGAIIGNFPVGNWKVYFWYDADGDDVRDADEAQVECNVYVSARALACNDDVQISIGNNCRAAINPDLVLEDPCAQYGADADVPRMRYDIEVSMNGNALTPVGTDANGYPVYDFSSVLADNCPAVVDYSVKRTYWLTCTDAAGAYTVEDECWGTLTVEDKIAPSIEAPADIVRVACEEDLTEAFIGAIDLGTPTVTDNCSATSSFEVGEVTEVDCDTWSVTVVWTATDQCDNTGTDNQTITFNRPDVVVQNGDESFNCTDANAPGPDADSCRPFLDYNGNGVYNTGDRYLSDGEVFCKYAATKSEVIFDLCGNGFKKVTTWTVVDWCDGSIDTEDCITKVEDNDAPIIDCPTDNELGTAGNPHQFGTEVFTCEGADISVPVPAVTDPCGSDVVGMTYAVYARGANVATSTPLASGDASGTVDLNDIDLNDGAVSADGCVGGFMVIFVAEDVCGNESAECRVHFDITDDQAPVAIAEESRSVSLGFDCSARVYATSFNDGSFDNCGNVTIQVRRLPSTDPSDFGEYVDFSSADLGDDCINNHMVELLVSDDCGNANSVMIDVTVEDKLAPVANNASDTESCLDYGYLFDDNTTDQEIIDAMVAHFNLGGSDNCEVVTTNIGDLDVDPDNCSSGTITLEYSLADECGNESNDATLTLNVDYEQDWKVTFPIDVVHECDDEGTGIPAAATLADILDYNNGCEQLGLEVEDEIFEADDACFKVVRTYKLINWCIWLPTGQALEVDRPGTMILDGADAIMVEEDDAVAATGYITYRQIIKVNDNVAPDFPAPGAVAACDDDGSCDEPVLVPTPGATDCSVTLTYTYRIEDTNGDFVAGGNYTPGQEIEQVLAIAGSPYTVDYEVEDGCGNSSSTSTTITITDCKAPSIVCIAVINVSVMDVPGGMIEVWLSDVVESATDDCSEPVKLRFQGQDFNEPLVISDICDVVVDGSTLGEYVIEAVDGADNVNSCNFVITVTDQENVCDGAPVDPLPVGGAIATELGDEVENVDVELSGNGDVMFTTGADGGYEFMAVPGLDYTITPNKDINPLNGVSTFDLVLISKHILGVEALGSPYSMIAADVNNSGSITTFDLVALRKLILNIDTEFTSNTSWRFVDAAYEFPQPNNPWAATFPEVINVNNHEVEMMTGDFVGIKVGDVNFSATPNNLLGGVEDRTNGALTFDVADVNVEAGNEYVVDFTADLNQIDGYQFTLNYDGLEVVDILEGAAKADNFAVFAEDGAITTSWNGEATDEVAFSLVFKATTNGQMSEMIAVSSEMTKAEAYNAEGNLDIELNFNGTATAAPFALYQNTPNPFDGNTAISFNLPKAGAATLTVQTSTGQVLKVVTAEYAKGYNQVILNSNELGAAGVLYYTLETADQTATRKMISIK